jgi:hypothetical protein
MKTLVGMVLPVVRWGCILHFYRRMMISVRGQWADALGNRVGMDQTFRRAGCLAGTV